MSESRLTVQRVDGWNGATFEAMRLPCRCGVGHTTLIEINERPERTPIRLTVHCDDDDLTRLADWLLSLRSRRIGTRQMGEDE